MASPKPIKYLEMHIVHNCNLNCPYCSHFCDIGYSGIIDCGTAREWLHGWSKRVQPAQIRLLGGEPFLHPELLAYIEMVREIFPKSKRTVVTNGLLLKQYEEWLPVFKKTGTRLNVSLHSVPKRKEQDLRDALDVMDRWQKKGIIFTVQHSHDGWFLPYQGKGLDIVPFEDNTPDSSFKTMCEVMEKRCITLHQGKLWKCAPLAYLPMVIDKLKNRGPWEKFLGYKPLAIDASEEEFDAFFTGNTEYCDICPSVRRKLTHEQLQIEGDTSVIISDHNRKGRKNWRRINRARLWARSLIPF